MKEQTPVSIADQHKTTHLTPVGAGAKDDSQAGNQVIDLRTEIIVRKHQLLRKVK